MEVTPINRQSYMAEVSSLLALITDETTRESLIAQMEQMFDAAEDEQKLIEQIGSPTKVAVALIRYADKKRAASAPVQAEEAIAPATPVTEMMADAKANAEAPEEDVMPELAYEEPEAPAEEPEGFVEEPEAPAEEPEGFVEEPEVPAEEPEVFAEEPEVAVEEPEIPAEEPEIPAEEPEAVEEPELPVVDEALAKAVAAGAAETFVETPAQEQLAEELPGEEPVEEPETAAPAVEEAEKELAEELFGQSETPDEEEEVETETRTVGWKAFLYFLIPGLVPGLPVFLVLFALSLVFLAIGAGAIGCAVGVISSAFIGFNVVADMLLLLGAGASIFAVALVLLWFGIWFLTQVCFGWVRLIHRGGIRFSRKEVLAD